VNERLYVGGEWIEPDGGHYEVLNPATEAVVGHAPEASVAQAREAARAARAALPAWAATPPEERGAILDRAADLLVQQADLPGLVAAESGTSLAIAGMMHVGATWARFKRYAKAAVEPVERALAPQLFDTTLMGPAGIYAALEVRHPVGVVTCITSYNNPLANTAGKVAPALAMGNTLLVKPAPQDPLAVHRLAQALADAGLPPGVLNVITGSGVDVGEAVVAAPEVDMISFTGSSAVGRRIAEVAGRHMKRQLMELGGKGAAVVLDDADLDAVVAAVETVWTFYAGQICTAPTRVIADRRVYGELVERLASRARELVVGDPADPGTDVGPVISAVQRDRVESLLRRGRDEGATVAAGGARPDTGKGFFVAPTLLSDCTNDMVVAREEFFGPVVVAIPFDGDDEAVALANDSDFGLMDYVFSTDSPRAFRLARRLEAGGVGINTIVQHGDAPFGGFKQSGVGRDRGITGLHAYSELQSLVWRS
jgi:acyl-CoA reductase-like NAD-dependent aldehyde dehydrogenase